MLIRPQGQITSQMPKFELKPVDGGNIVHLPEGETVFGRGPLFGVNDKRVSRHHGVLENVDGVLRIKPTHLNPCFIQSSLEADPQPLKRDQWHTLGPGDLFSLLPGKHIYRVEDLEETVEKETEDEDEDEGTLRNSQNLDVENRSQRHGEEVVPEEAKTSCSALPSANEEPEQSTSSGREDPWASQQSTLVVSLANRSSVEFPPSSPTGDLGSGGGGETPAPQQRKRTLPAWMMTAAGGEVKTPSTPKGAGKRGPAKGAAATTTPKPKPKAASQAMATTTATPIRGAPKRARTRVLSSEDEDEDAAAAEVPEEEEEEEKEVVQVAKRRRKRRKSSEEDDEAEEETEAAAAPPAQDVKPSRQAAPALDEMSEESDSMEVEQAMDKNKVEKEEEEEKQQVEVKRRTGGAPGSSSLSSRDTEESGGSKRNGSKPSSQNGHRAPQVAAAAAAAAAAGGSGRKRTKRTACPYGSACYRKNPIHFQECSHPGDSDYEEEAEEEVDEEDDDRPECPYGTDCYRTNPLHKKEYKHTRPPARTSARASRRDRDDEEEDEDAYDDSFINDDSEEDLDEDSDYVPDDSGDSGKEDVKRLKKEAKAFLHRKK